MSGMPPIFEVPPDQIGLKGSPTQVRRTFSPEPKGAGTVIKADPSASVRQLVNILQTKGLL